VAHVMEDQWHVLVSTLRKCGGQRMKLKEVFEKCPVQFTPPAIFAIIIVLIVGFISLLYINAGIKDELKLYESHKCIAGDTIHDTLIIQKDGVVKAVADTQAIFYDIPYDKMNDFSILWEAVYGDNVDEEPTYSSKKNQRLWQFLRDMFSHDFKPYMKDGISYSWCITHINSNVVCVTNTYLFEWNEKKVTIEYGKANERK